jgi:predicted secreted protein
MELARSFLEACSDAVDKVGTAETVTLRADFNFRYSKFAAHYASCPKCGEA